MLGVCFVHAKLHTQQHEKKLQFVVSNIPILNFREREGIQQLNISVDGLMHGQTTQKIQQVKPNRNLKVACQKVYRRTPLPYGYPPRELPNGRQIRTKIDTPLPSPARLAQSKQMQDNQSTKTVNHYSVGTPCYALYYEPKRDQQPKWVEAVVLKCLDAGQSTLECIPKDQVGKDILNSSVLDLLSKMMLNTLMKYHVPTTTTSQPLPLPEALEPRPQTSRERNPRLPDGNKYTRDNPRRSKRNKK